MLVSRLVVTLAGLVCGSGAGLSAQAPSTRVTSPGKVKVFILAGQSNMEGKARVELAEYQAGADETKAYYEDLRSDGRWLVRDDVWVEFSGRRGPLTVGFGSPGCIGPELRFGMVVGDRFDEQVLLIKTAWGGKSLGRDFLPPSARQPSDAELAAIVAKENENNRKNRRPETSVDEVRGRYGKCYRDMLTEVRGTLADLGARFPKSEGQVHPGQGYPGQGYELAGFVWFQGWNDQYDETFVAGYLDNLQHLVRDVRRDLACPNLPVVVGQMGQNGLQPAKGNMLRIQQAQAAIAELPEFQGNVRSVATDVFWDAAAAAKIDGWEKHVDEWKKVGSDRAYHYLGSVRTFGEIGRAFGQAMVELIDGR